MPPVWSRNWCEVVVCSSYLSFILPFTCKSVWGRISLMVTMWQLHIKDLSQMEHATAEFLGLTAYQRHTIAVRKNGRILNNPLLQTPSRIQVHPNKSMKEQRLDVCYNSVVLSLFENDFLQVTPYSSFLNWWMCRLTVRWRQDASLKIYCSWLLIKPYHLPYHNHLVSLSTLERKNQNGAYCLHCKSIWYSCRQERRKEGNAADCLRIL